MQPGHRTVDAKSSSTSLHVDDTIGEIAVDIPRPRPIVLGDVPQFSKYVDRIHRHFERLGVLHGLDTRSAH